MATILTREVKKKSINKEREKDVIELHEICEQKVLVVRLRVGLKTVLPLTLHFVW